MSSLSSSVILHPCRSSPSLSASIYSRYIQTILVLIQSKPWGMWIIGQLWNSHQTKHWIMSVLLGSCVSLSKPPNLWALSERIGQSAKSFWVQNSVMFSSLSSLLLSSLPPFSSFSHFLPPSLLLLIPLSFSLLPSLPPCSPHSLPFSSLLSSSAPSLVPGTTKWG